MKRDSKGSLHCFHNQGLQGLTEIRILFRSLIWFMMRTIRVNFPLLFRQIRFP